MQYNTLSNIGFSKYILTVDGRLFRTTPKARELKKDQHNRFYLISDCGKPQRISLKDLYRQVYNKEYCIDNTTDLINEEWQEIQGTNGKYYISNYGRVKSLCKYNAIILQPYKKHNGYLIVKINGKNTMIHRLVAFAFCQNNFTGQKVEIHHKDSNRSNNKADNLMILSVAEHHKLHNEKEKNDNEKLLSTL